MVSSINGSNSWNPQQMSNVTPAQRHKEMFQKLDANGDGKIDESELQAVVPANGKGLEAKTLLKQMDTNGDGTINENENDAILTKMESSRKASGPPPGGAPPDGASGKTEGTSSSGNSSAKIYDKRDTNKDGKVSFMEQLMYDIKHSSQAKKIIDENKTADNVQSYDLQGQSIATTTSGLVNTTV